MQNKNVFIYKLFRSNSCKDIQNLIEFLYTGELSLSKKNDYEIIQKLLCEWQIGLDNDVRVFITDVEENESVAATISKQTDETNRVY